MILFLKVIQLLFTLFFLDLMDSTLSKLGIKNGTQFDCDDFVQHLQFKLIAFNSSNLEAEEFEIVSAGVDLALTANTKQRTNGNGLLKDEKNYNNGKIIINDNIIDPPRKRQSLFIEEESTSPKRSRISE